MNLLLILKYIIEIVVFIILWIDWYRFSWYRRDRDFENTSEYTELLNQDPKFLAMNFKEREQYYYKHYDIKFYRRIDMKRLAAVLVLVIIIISIYLDVSTTSTNSTNYSWNYLCHTLNESVP
jgi:uncharacterized membrane protein